MADLWRGRDSWHVVVLATSLLTSVLIVGLLIFSTEVKKLFVHEKAWELTIQFFFVAVFGGAIALAFRLWEAERAERTRIQERDREERLAWRKSLEDFFQECVTAHHQSKRIRRTLRANSYEASGHLFIRRDCFEEQMNELEDCQLKAENLKRFVEIRKDLFGEEQKHILRCYVLSEKYLRSILRSYEDDYDNRRAINSSDPIKIEPPLSNYIRTDADGRGSKELFNEVEKAREIISSLISSR